MTKQATLEILSVSLMLFAWAPQATAQDGFVSDSETESVLELIAVEDVPVAKLMMYESDCSAQKGTDLAGSLPSNPFADGNKPPVIPAPSPVPGIPTPVPGIPTPVRPPNTPISPYPVRPGTPYGYSELDQIVNAGLRIWAFIRDNSPTVTSRYAYAHALPKAIKCWDQLAGWSVPRSEIYRLTVKPKWGRNPDVTFDFRLIYQWGGSADGVGHYIANATVQYRNIQSAWGVRSVDANVAVSEATNVARPKEQPVASLTLTVEWIVKKSNDVRGMESFTIFGDGRPTIQNL